MKFSILIPTWNNLSFLKLCVQSIRTHSFYEHQIIVHVNEGSDGTLEWIKGEQIDYTVTATNVGICTAMNKAAALIKHDYVLYMNDDMYCLPGWDTELVKEIRNLDTDCFMLSSTMIEPYNTKNRCVIVSNYGSGADDFNESRLLKEFARLPKKDWSGSTWPPCVVHKKWWDKVVGYSEEFSPGMSSDDDFAMKMWKAGCRIYKGVSASRVYHFISKSTGRVAKNDGRRQFRKKWGIKQSNFHKYYILRGETYKGKLSDPRFNLGYLLQRLVSKVTIR